MAKKRREVDKVVGEIHDAATKQVKQEIRSALIPPDGQPPRIVPFTRQQLTLLVQAQATAQAASQQAQLVLNTICAGLDIDPRAILRIETESDPPAFVCAPEVPQP